jgi:glutaredoxin-like YruB-family protein
MYTIPNCKYCAQAKGFFAQKGITYREIDVLANNKEFAREMIEKSGQKTVPVIEIDGKIIVGFQPEQFLAALT